MSSLWGIRYANEAGARTIDSDHIVPKMVARLSAANLTSTVDETDAEILQTGWVMRTFTWRYLAEGGVNRPRQMFWTLPADGTETYMVATNGGFDSATGHDIYTAAVMARSAGTIGVPFGYAFALDYVDPPAGTSDMYGRQTWRDDGTLTYDSRNAHLNLQLIGGGVDTPIVIDTSTTVRDSVETVSSLTVGALPAKAAVCVLNTETLNDFAVRFEGRGLARYSAFFRVQSGTLYNIPLRYTRTFDEDTAEPVSFSHTATINRYNSNQFMVIDASMYD